MRYKSPLIGYAADSDGVQVHLPALFARLIALWNVDPRALYVRVEQYTHERTFSAYEDWTDGYYHARELESHFGGRPARDRYGSKRMAREMFGRSGPGDRTVFSTRLTARDVTNSETEFVPQNPTK